MDGGVVEGFKVLREYQITDGKIQVGDGRGRRGIMDHVLVYKGIKLAVCVDVLHSRNISIKGGGVA